MIIAAPASKAVIVEDISSEGADENAEGYRGSLVEIFADNDSKIKFVSVQKLGQGFYDIGSKKAVAMNNARVDWVFAAVGGKITKLEVSPLLDGRGAFTENLGMFIGNGSQQFDIFTSAVHNAPNTNSDLLTKGSLRERSKSIYRGLVNIKQHAKGCDGFQRADTLLLSPYAQADAIPFLEIDNNDVKCTHAASIGQVDKEKIFYMQSRGLSYEESEKQIVQGFFEGVMEKIDSEEIREALREIIMEKA